MITPVVIPPIAAQAGCRVDVDVEHTTSSEYNEYLSTDQYDYTLTPVAASNWMFRDYNAHVTCVFKNPSQSINRQYQGLLSDAPSWVIKGFNEFTHVGTNNDPGYYDYKRIDWLTAVFEWIGPGNPPYDPNDPDDPNNPKKPYRPPKDPDPPPDGPPPGPVQTYLVTAEAAVEPWAASQAGCTATARPSNQSGALGETASIVFSASAVRGWKFKEWGDGTTSATRTHNTQFGPYDKNAAMVAFFERDPDAKFTVTTEASPENAGTTSGDGEYESGATCTVTANEKCSPWTFVEWVLSTGARSSQKSYTFTVNSDVTCTARFSHSSSGAPYYDADGQGQIVCGQDGSILYDGDEV